MAWVMRYSRQMPQRGNGGIKMLVFVFEGGVWVVESSLAELLIIETCI